MAPKKSNSHPTRATGCSAASSFSPTPSRSRLVPRAATSCSTSHLAPPLTKDGVTVAKEIELADK